MNIKLIFLFKIITNILKHIKCNKTINLILFMKILISNMENLNIWIKK